MVLYKRFLLTYLLFCMCSWLFKVKMNHPVVNFCLLFLWHWHCVLWHCTFINFINVSHLMLYLLHLVADSRKLFFVTEKLLTLEDSVIAASTLWGVYASLKIACLFFDQLISWLGRVNFHRVPTGPWKSLNFFFYCLGLKSSWKQVRSFKVIEILTIIGNMTATRNGWKPYFR